MIRVEEKSYSMRLVDILDHNLAYNKEALSLYLLENKKPEGIKEIFADIINYLAITALKQGLAYRRCLEIEG